jgi:hypothetical protein
VYLLTGTHPNGDRHRRGGPTLTPTQFRRIRTRLIAAAEDLFASIVEMPAMLSSSIQVACTDLESHHKEEASPRIGSYSKGLGAEFHHSVRIGPTLTHYLLFD